MTDTDPREIARRLLLNTPVITQEHMDAATEIMPKAADALTAALDRIDALTAERDDLRAKYGECLEDSASAWNDAIEAAACASETEGMSALNYPDEAIAKSYCDDAAMIIRSLKKGEPT